MEEPFNPFGDPEELRRRLGEFAEQMERAARLVRRQRHPPGRRADRHSIHRLNLQGTSDEQATQVRDAIPASSSPRL